MKTEHNRIVSIAPDPEDVVSRGYACVKGRELLTSDGTAAGTALVRDIRAGLFGLLSHFSFLAYVNGTIFFGANDESGLRSPDCPALLPVAGAAFRRLGER